MGRRGCDKNSGCGYRWCYRCIAAALAVSEHLTVWKQHFFVVIITYGVTDGVADGRMNWVTDGAA